MVNNLPLILSILRTWGLMLLCLLASASVQAHPGHEGHEDGGEFVWTFEHLTRHPFATALCATVAVLALWLVLRPSSAQRASAKAVVAPSPVAEKRS